MSRARKLCEELNAVVKEHGKAYITYNYNGGLTVSPDITTEDLVIIAIYDEVSEELILDQLLMLWEDECDIRLRWEDECDSCARHLVPSYLWAIRNRLWSDYNVD